MIADRVESADGATYLDRALAQSAAALEAATGDHPDEAARRRMSCAEAVVEATDDRVAKAVVQLAAAAVANRLALPEAEQLAARADHSFAKLGVDPAGWRQVFALATRAVAT